MNKNIFYFLFVYLLSERERERRQIRDRAMLWVSWPGHGPPSPTQRWSAPPAFAPTLKAHRSPRNMANKGLEVKGDRTQSLKPS